MTGDPPPGGPGRSATAAYAAFAAFGLFWGTWGASLPALRAAADVGEGALGTALLFVGVGALPAMWLAGRAVDRLGARVSGVLLVAMASAGVLTASTSLSWPGLAAGMLVVGATSGAADVAENALAGLAEQRSGRRVITTSHAVFSSGVVAGSLLAGLLQSAGLDVVVVFASTGGVMAVLGAAVLVLGDPPQAATPATPVAEARGRDSLRWAWPFVAVGLVGALGFAVENAHQSWSAIFLGQELGATAGMTAVAPATFAGFAAVARFAAGALRRIPETWLLVGGAAVAVVGTLLVAASHNVPSAVSGLALAAVGTSVLFPTLLSRATRDVAPDARGRATSAVAATSYLGFLVGPVFVGQLAALGGLRFALVGVAVLAGVFGVLAPVVTRRG